MTDTPGMLSSAGLARGLAQPTQRAAYVLCLIALAGGFDWACRYVLIILIEPIKKELGLSDTSMGLLTGTTSGIVYLLLGITVSVWADRGVRRSILAYCLTLWSLMTIACGFTQNLWQLVTARMGVAVGEASALPIISSLTADLYPRSQRGTATGVVYACSYVGYGLSFIIGGTLSELYGWRTALIAVGIPGLLLALLIRFTVEEPQRGRFDPASMNVTVPIRAIAQTLWRIPSLRFLVLTMALADIANAGIVSWIPSFLQRVHGYSIQEAGLWFGITSGLGMALGAFVGGILTDRLVRRDLRWYGWFIGVVCAIKIPLAVTALFWPGSTGSLLWFTLAQVLMSSWQPTLIAATLALVPPRLRSIAATVVVIGGSSVIGWGFGPPMIGAFNDWMAPALGAVAVRYSILIMLGMYVLVIPASLLLARRLLHDLPSDSASPATVG